MISNTKTYSALFYSGESSSTTNDTLAIEVDLSIAINDVPFTVTMQTPGNEVELARGLLYTESIYQSQRENPSIQILSKNELGFVNALNIAVPKQLLLKEFAGTRNVISASSCGMCGKTSLDNIQLPALNNNSRIDPTVVTEMFEQVSRLQKTFIQSGGTHAAGAFTLDGKLLSMMEDIGRHNAVDKVIGDLLNQNNLAQAHCLTVSGRISYEIVHKASVAGIAYLASVSAPSSLAVDYAQASGITLMAFCRNGKLTAYSNIQRIETALDVKL